MKRAKLEEMTVDKLVEGFLRRSPLTHHDSLRHRCALSRKGRDAMGQATRVWHHRCCEDNRWSAP